MSNSKAAIERQVFEEFVVAAGLATDAGSIRSEKPPCPDISCRISGELRYFELTRAADQCIANDVGVLLKKAGKFGEGGVGQARSYDDKQELRSAVEQKSAKNYETHGSPLDLVVYYDGIIHPIPMFDLVVSTFQELQNEYRQHWNAIWLFDWPNKHVLR